MVVQIKDVCCITVLGMMLTGRANWTNQRGLPEHEDLSSTNKNACRAEFQNHHPPLSWTLSACRIETHAATLFTVVVLDADCYHAASSISYQLNVRIFTHQCNSLQNRYGQSSGDHCVKKHSSHRCSSDTLLLICGWKMLNKRNGGHARRKDVVYRGVSSSIHRHFWVWSRCTL